MSMVSPVSSVPIRPSPRPAAAEEAERIIKIANAERCLRAARGDRQHSLRGRRQGPVKEGTFAGMDGDVEEIDAEPRGKFVC